MKKNKLHGCGNSFLVIDKFEKGIVNNKKQYTIENADKEKVDGVLFVERSDNSEADIKMLIFDRDGTEETMCGNGIRCFARYAHDNGYIPGVAKIMTGDGIKNVEIDNNFVRVNLGKPREFQKIDDKKYFVFTGVPHLVWFRNELDLDFAREEGRRLRYDKSLCELVGHPEGICVNFVKCRQNSNLIRLMTYEVGVEDVTKACGTGSAASAYVANKIKGIQYPIIVRNIGGKLEIDLIDGNLMMKGPAEYL